MKDFLISQVFKGLGSSHSLGDQSHVREKIKRIRESAQVQKPSWDSSANVTLPKEWGATMIRPEVWKI